VDPRRVEAVGLRAHRHAARGVDQRVVRLVVLPSGLQVPGGDPPGGQVDADHLGAHPQVDPVGPVLLGVRAMRSASLSTAPPIQYGMPQAE
jgi:hypothetical protein